jgi:hypothetical protein
MKMIGWSEPENQNLEPLKALLSNASVQGLKSRADSGGGSWIYGATSTNWFSAHIFRSEDGKRRVAVAASMKSCSPRYARSYWQTTHE